MKRRRKKKKKVKMTMMTTTTTATIITKRNETMNKKLVKLKAKKRNITYIRDCAPVDK